MTTRPAVRPVAEVLQEVAEALATLQAQMAGLRRTAEEDRPARQAAAARDLAKFGSPAFSDPPAGR